ncbi:unnamed protein product [Ectocarpus sp. 8 AP-2014]
MPSLWPTAATEISMTCRWGLATATILIRAAAGLSVTARPTRTNASSVVWRTRGGRFSSGGPRMAAGVVVAGDSVGDAPFPTPEPTASTVARGDGSSSRPLPRLNAPPHDHVRHAYSPRAGPLWSSVAAFLGWTEELARGLITFGGVYYKPGGAPASAKPKRELDPDREGW